MLCLRAIASVGAAPHPPAGTFSPYRDGEKGLAATLGTLSAMLEIGEILCEGVFLPVTIRGEMPGRAMRGGAEIDNWPFNMSWLPSFVRSDCLPQTRAKPLKTQ